MFCNSRYINGPQTTAMDTFVNRNNTIDRSVFNGRILIS